MLAHKLKHRWPVSRCDPAASFPASVCLRRLSGNCSRGPLAAGPLQKLLNDESDEEEDFDTFSEDEDMMPPDMDVLFQFFAYM